MRFIFFIRVLILYDGTGYSKNLSKIIFNRASFFPRSFLYFKLLLLNFLFCFRLSSPPNFSFLFVNFQVELLLKNTSKFDLLKRIRKNRFFIWFSLCGSFSFSILLTDYLNFDILQISLIKNNFLYG